MKIAVIGVRGFPGIQGGVEHHCERIYHRFDKSVEFRVYRRTPYLSAESNASYPHIRFVDLPSTRIKGFEAVFHTLICCLHLLFHRVDIVHIHNIGPGMFTPLLRLFGMSVVLTYHSPNYEHNKWGSISKMILRVSEFMSLRFANRIIFVNKFQLAKFSETTRRKSVYVPNGMERVTCSDATDYIDRIGAKKGEYVLGVGRLTPEKGFEYLVSAVNEVDGIPQLVIAGGSDHDTGYYERLKTLDRNHKVIFTGYTSGEDLRQLYSHAKLFVLSSVNEGFPLVMLEAMGYGLPMVVSDIPATHLIDLPADWYATSCDVSSFKERLTELYPSCQKQEYDMTEYDWDEVVRVTHDVYKTAIGA